MQPVSIMRMRARAVFFGFAWCGALPIHKDIRHIFKQPLFGRKPEIKATRQSATRPSKTNLASRPRTCKTLFQTTKKRKDCFFLLAGVCCLLVCGLWFVVCGLLGCWVAGLPVFVQPHAGCLRVVFEQVRLGLLVGGLRADKRCCSRRACRCSSAQAACVQLCRWWPRLDLQGIELNAATGFRAGDRYLLCSCLAIVGIGLRRKGEGRCQPSCEFQAFA